MNSPDFTGEARLAALRLARTQGIGPVNFGRLLQHYGDAVSALEALPSLKGAKHLNVTSRQAAERELAAIDRAGARLFIAASTTSVPRERPDMIRLRRGKSRAVGRVPSGVSDRIRPVSAIA